MRGAIGPPGYFAFRSQYLHGRGSREHEQHPAINQWTSLGAGMKPLVVQDYLNPITYREYTPLGRDAGEIAIEHGISREEQDAWALSSHQKWAAADKAGKFTDELVSVELPSKKGVHVIFGKDELPRPDTTMDALAKLKTIYGSPTVTAGNAPVWMPEATAVIVMRRSKAESLGIKPFATIVAVASGAGEPRRMAELPAKVIGRALERASLTIDDMK